MDTNVFAAPIVSTRIVHKIEPLARSLAFYQNLFGLTIVERPPFKNARAWLACGAMQVHLILHPSGQGRKDYLPRKANAKLDFLGSVHAAQWNAGD